MMKINFSRASLALLGIGLCLSGPLVAQGGGRGGQNPMNGQNPGGRQSPNGRQNQMGGGRGQGGQNERGGRPQDRGPRELMLLQSAGYTDQTLLSTVSAFLQNRDQMRKNLNEAARALMDGLRDGGTVNAADFESFEKLLATERQRSWNAEKQLDSQIRFSKDAKLRAVLTLAGVIGDARNYLNGPGMGGPPQGGPGGGRMGGEMGGPGGQGGPMDGPMGRPPGGPPMDDFGMGGPDDFGGAF